MSSSNSAMDVDGAPGPLKRSSSAPMINEASSSAMASASSSNSTPSGQTSFNNLFGPVNPTRTRRFSASFSQVPGSPVAGPRTPRINQIRQEEHEVLSNSRELAHEKEIHNAMQISQSWEDLSLIESSGEPKNSRMGPIHVSLPNNSFMTNSPSPTSCRGYGFQSPTRSRQTFIRRSESPVFRPSPLGVKRKLEDKDIDFHTSPRAKRVYSYSASDSRGLLTTTSTSLPGSLSSVGTPESLSSADSPGSGFAFRNVDSPSPTLQAGQGEPMMVGKNDHDMTEGPS
ncbi:uncharacterized protein LOC143202407 isoform X2 [Rhynchophorus ferrugineus]|uniref:uncharacterized protein LOC143202407 isoform X2 n=1 Tax=Rhynchophorus ferrugineus TaxID=354439 RepID=UPI003FCD13B6